MASGVNQNGATSKQELAARRAARARRRPRDRGRDPGRAAAGRRARRVAADAARGLDELVREGMLLRRHGRGTYVAEPKIALPLTMTSFSEDMRRRGMQPGSRVPLVRGSDARARSSAPPAGVAGRPRRGRSAACAWPTRDDGDRDPARARALAPGLHAARPRGPVVLRPAGAALRHRHRAGHADHRADRDQRGGGRGPGRPAALAGVPLRADQRERARGGGGVRPVDLSR